MSTQANGFRVRGYMVLNAATYLRDVAGEQESKRIIEGFSPQARELITAAKPADWSPVESLSEITRALAGLAKGDDDRARDMLINCGVYMAREASNTFLRILLKMVTPSIFVKKLPEFWTRDCTQGRVVPELGDKRVVVRTYDMAGFDHAPCTAAGFVTFVLQTMGKAVQQTAVHDWSIDRPVVDGARFEIAWSN